MMEIKIFQVNMDRDTDRVCFESLDILKKRHGKTDVDASIYDLVYSGQVEAGKLEDVYRIFNNDHPEGYTARSLSVSDVVQVVKAENKEPGFYFCNSIGFQKIPFDADKAENGLEKKKTLKVVLVEPGKAAKEAEIGADLASLQKAVGGYIERFCPFPDACIVCNEEGKFNGMIPNRAIRGEDGDIMDVIFGTFFICAAGERDFISLTPEQITAYKEKFKRPERVVSINGSLMVIPYDAPAEMKEGTK